MGSDQRYFTYNAGDDFFKYDSLKCYWSQTALPSANNALSAAQISAKKIAPFKSIQQLFPFIEAVTPLQQYALDVVLSEQPQLFMLEDVTGAGKTEAALTLVHRLLDLGTADGVYIALPTMATANGMYARLGEAYRKMYHTAEKPSLVLAHGASQFSKQYQQSIASFIPDVVISPQVKDQDYQDNEESASAYCSAWVADSRKKALLADVGVGTLDQALLAILPAKHQSLRLLGLSRKVLVIDEVHAYDSYMQGLLETLLEAQARQGGSVILLSATLPFSMRTGLANAFMAGRGQVLPVLTNATDNYPLATQIPAVQHCETKVTTRKEVARKVFVEHLASEQKVLDLIQMKVAQGKSVCWVRNTVNSAKKSFDDVSLLEGIKPDKLTLFHSRFAMIDRQRIENHTLKIFGKNSTECERCGQVLLATQVVEQSLDLDFDILITDLAPIDLVLQRAGRLHRHVRDNKGNRLSEGEADQRGQPTLYLFSPEASENAGSDWLTSLLPSIEYVYPDLGQLWLSAKLLLVKPSFNMPQDARRLIEGVYGLDVKSEIPDGLSDNSFEARLLKRQERGMAHLNALDLQKGYSMTSAENNSGWDDDVNIPTRLAETTYAVALARVVDGRLQPYAQDESQPRATCWALSCVNLREGDWEKVEKSIPKQWQQQIEQLKEQEPSLKWLQILPLVEGLLACYDENKGWNSSGVAL
ncbi:CRISPR-associated helicase Cas3' [Thalassomonas haliotis]|uniref:CRISPR-associated helicase Cas3' n=1 Tax=Thalassomonas haliotis TaxID=485448 RepID=UPI003B6859A8